MKRADPAKGESGGWALYIEGVDNDGDGFYNEDGPGGVDINRNFMHQYPYFAADAGRYMASEAETRALLDYVLQHRNIAAILAFGESDNLITAGGRPAACGGPQPGRFRRACQRASPPGGHDARSRRRDGARFGRGGGGMFMFGDEGGPPGAGRRRRRRRAGRRRRSAGHGGERGRPRVLHRDWRQVPRVDRPAQPPGSSARRRARSSSTATSSTGCPPSRRRAGDCRAGAGRLARAAARPVRRGGGPAFRRSGGMPACRGRWPGGAGPARRRPRRARRRRAADGDIGEGIDLRLLQWMDSEKVDGFVNWAPFKHPTLGDVEIGGLQALRDGESARRQNRRSRRGAREVRRAPDVAVRASRDREDGGDGARRRPLPHQGRRRERRLPADGDRAGRDGAFGQAGDGPARRAAGVHHHGRREDELHPGAGRLGQPAVVRMGDQGQSRVRRSR